MQLLLFLGVFYINGLLELLGVGLLLKTNPSTLYFDKFWKNVFKIRHYVDFEEILNFPAFKKFKKKSGFLKMTVIYIEIVLI